MLQQVFTWKALRLIAKYKLQHFAQIASGKIEDIVKVMAEEKKGTLREDSTISTVDDQADDKKEDNTAHNTADDTSNSALTADTSHKEKDAH